MLINLVGRRFGWLKVIRLGTRRVPKHTYWLCECGRCGKRKEIRADNLVDGRVVSCGCYHRFVMAKSGIHHKPGTRFARLVVISEAGRSRKGRLYCCRCDCGRKVVVAGQHLRSGEVRSCGCLYNETRRTANLRHGQNHNPTHGGSTGAYRAYHREKGWCNNPRDREYRRYGARGIELRFESFDAFYREVGPKPGEDYALQRIDSDGHFQAGNLAWVEIPHRKHRRHRS